MAGENFVLNQSSPGGRAEEDRYREIVLDTMKLISQLSTTRTQLNLLCEEVAARVAPAWVGHFVFPGDPVPYQKNTELQTDSTGMLALSRFMAICDSLLSPKNQMWHNLKPADDYLLKDRATKLWFYNTNRKLFKMRYAPEANFSANNQGVYHSLGAFGTGIMFIDGYYDMMAHKKALRYKNIPFGEIYLTQDHQGRYNGFIRRMRFTAAEIYTMFPGVAENIGILKTALDTKSQRKFIVFHRVCAKDQYDASKLDYRGMPYASYHILAESQTMLREGGYHTLPIAASRYYQGPNEQDGRGIAMDVLPSLKTLDAEKRMFLKTGHRAADPVLLLQDDGLMNMNLKPGAQNRGGVNSEGQPLVHALPTGELQITMEMMAEEKNLINDAMLVALFQIMTEKNGMTATEVIERINEKGILIAPTLGRQEGEYFGPLIERELAVMASWGLLDPMPPALREAGGQYDVFYSSPLAKAMRAQEAAGFMRTIENVKELVNITQDPSLLDPFDFDVALPEIADIQGVPEPWMASPEKIAAKRANRAKAAERQQQIQAAPAAAALMKAQAAVQQNGGPSQGAPVAPVGA